MEYICIESSVNRNCHTLINSHNTLRENFHVLTWLSDLFVVVRGIPEKYEVISLGFMWVHLEPWAPGGLGFKGDVSSKSN